MLKTGNPPTLSRSPEAAENIEAPGRHVASGSALGVVHCFVDPEELRRLLSIMAGTELVSEMVQSVFS
jgi:hypothetical protein